MLNVSIFAGQNILCDVNNYFRQNLHKRKRLISTNQKMFKRTNN
jgi:hypothetical protein